MKTRKTASTSIEFALSSICGQEDVLTKIPKENEIARKKLGYAAAQNYRFGDNEKIRRHGTACEARAFVGEEIWNAYYKFAFDRNPFDKAVSLYYWRCRDMENPPSISDFISAAAKSDLSNWHIYADEMKIIVDDVFRYEDLNKAFSLIANTILKDPENAEALVDCLAGINTEFRPQGSSHASLLDPETRRIIARNCLPEINHFGYSI